ncbi:hypothetical protein DMN91_011679 [Ooceraea biroi]|uniref:Uncharacterized protein n=1 Tax=Ooceraea biroi TaxID=2015173 RepID=A0A3L8D632_OOCBI|nr:hypothetical protein DMN91_011679 [Ooceraea biroi]
MSSVPSPETAEPIVVLPKGEVEQPVEQQRGNSQSVIEEDEEEREDENMEVNLEPEERRTSGKLRNEVSPTLEPSMDVVVCTY